VDKDYGKGGPTPDGLEGPTPARFVRFALLFYGALGCGALFWRMSTPGQSVLHPSPAAQSVAFDLVPALVAGVGVGLLAVAFSEALTRWTELGEALARVLGESLAGIGRADAMLLALASGLAEEMFFRGALQPAVGLVWSSVLFAACHFLPRRELVLWSLFALVMGFALGGLYLWTGHLAAPIAAHVVINAINLPRLIALYETKPGPARAVGGESDDPGP